MRAGRGFDAAMRALQGGLKGKGCSRHQNRGHDGHHGPAPVQQSHAAIVPRAAQHNPCMSSHAAALTSHHIIGVDFTSSPTSNKPITVARGSVQGRRVSLGRVDALPSFAAFEALLREPHRHAQPARAGADDRDPRRAPSRGRAARGVLHGRQRTARSALPHAIYSITIDGPVKHA